MRASLFWGYFIVELLQLLLLIQAPRRLKDGSIFDDMLSEMSAIGS